MLTKTELNISNDWVKMDEKSLQAFTSDNNNNKFPCESFTLLTPIPSILVPGTSIKIDISGSCSYEKTLFTFYPYLYLEAKTVVIFTALNRVIPKPVWDLTLWINILSLRQQEVWN